MKESFEVIFFDLFFTLVLPKYNDGKNENDVLGISKEEWEKFAEDDELYYARASGKEFNLENIIRDIFIKMNIQINHKKIAEILELRQERFGKALIYVDQTILNVLREIKNQGKRLCLISNADIIDVEKWGESPLKTLFDEVVFSYQVGYLKPDKEIYDVGLKKMNVIAEKCIFIGDGGSHELKGAKELGMKTILVEHLLKRENENLEEILKYADYRVSEFKDILEYLM